MTRPSAHAAANVDETRDVLRQRREHADRIAIARSAGGSDRKLLGAVKSIRVTRKAGR